MFATFFMTFFGCASCFNKGLFTRGLSEIEEWEQFSSFQERFSKKYSSLSEFEHRFKVFRSNLRNIISHNLLGNQNFTMGINHFTDLTAEEFKNLYASGLKSSLYSHDHEHQQPLRGFGCKTFSSATSSLPQSVDWRSKGIVNPVRDQGQCGSCWAFATTANAESSWALANHQLLDLSEEYLVDCASGVGYFNMGCDGGNPDSAFKYMINNGQCVESQYPYVAGKTKTAGTCQKCTSSGTHFSSCSDIPSNNQLLLKAAVAQQPVVVAIEADTRYFQSYSGGILTSTSCGTNLDHAVEIVGYGEENGIKYWIVRNSWSSSWGESGYVRILRTDSPNDIGVCGIASQPSFISV